MNTLDSIDAHLTRTWLRMCEARNNGRPTTEYRHIIDTLLDQRLTYQDSQ